MRWRCSTAWPQAAPDESALLLVARLSAHAVTIVRALEVEPPLDPDEDRAAGSRLGGCCSRRSGRAAAAVVLWLVACAPPPAPDIAGLYRHEGPVAATLEVRAEGGEYVVRLEGGGSPAAGPASAADCVIEARGDLDGAVLRAPFGPVETDTFSYGAAQARREGRIVEIVFEPGAAEVIEAGTVGYCGWGTELSGRYRAVA